jgi:hypothetical protein
MRHRTLFVVSVPIAVLFSVLSASSAPAQVITDLTYGLAALSEPELLVDWVGAGTGIRAGIRVTTSGDTRYYTNSNLVLDNGEAYLMDIVFSGQATGADGERGARMWVRFRDPSLPPLLYRYVEARFLRDAGTNRVGLFNSPSAPFASPLASLPQDWTSASPRLRVRIRYQSVAGVPTIFLVAEDSTQWAPDLSEPLTPDASNTLSLLVDGTTFPPSPGSSEFGFGNVVAGSYFADYETVRIIRSSESDTVLPAAFDLAIPTLGVSGIAVLVILFATAGLALLVRYRYA